MLAKKLFWYCCLGFVAGHVSDNFPDGFIKGIVAGAAFIYLMIVKRPE